MLDVLMGTPVEMLCGQTDTRLNAAKVLDLKIESCLCLSHSELYRLN